MARITKEEKRDRIDTAHECIRRRLNRRESRAAFRERHGINEEKTVYRWLRYARAELAESIKDHINDQIANSFATLEAVISKSFASGELRTAVAAQAEINRLLLFEKERITPSADAVTNAEAIASAADRMAIGAMDDGAIHRFIATLEARVGVSSPSDETVTGGERSAFPFLPGGSNGNGSHR